MSFLASGLESNFHLYKNKLKNNHDALALFIHWYLIQNGFKCIRNDGKLTEILPDDWVSDEQVYLVKYTKDSKGYELKLLIVDEHLMINLARLKDERVASLSVAVSDHVNSVNNEYDGVYKNLQDLYDKLHNEFNSLFKTPVTTTASKSESRPKSPERKQQPIIQPSSLVDPLRVRRPERIPPTDIGRSDIDPFYFDPLGGGGMIFDPFRTGGLPRPRIPSDLPPGAVPPGARFDPFQPPNPDAMIPGSSRMGPNPNHLQKPPGYDDMFM